MGPSDGLKHPISSPPHRAVDAVAGTYLPDGLDFNLVNLRPFGAALDVGSARIDDFS